MDYRDYTYPEDFIGSEPDYEDIPNDIWEAISYMEDDHVFETYSDLTYSDLFRSELLDVPEDQITYHLWACREDLAQSVVDHLKTAPNLVGAWLSACQGLPGVQGLEDLKRLHPTALPSWLPLERGQELLVMQGVLEVRAGNHVVYNNDEWEETKARAAEREAQLERFRRCRFQEGFASEGMLCNSPPIPLRVLDYLEAADLLSLSLVCKATHRASHYLFHREEEVLSRPDIMTFELDPRRFDPPQRHCAMRAASLMCGRPESVDVRRWHPNLLHNLVPSSDACTQPHVRWNDWSPEYKSGLSAILKPRRAAIMAQGDEFRAFELDTKGWPEGDQEAIADLRRRLGCRIRTRTDKAWSQQEEEQVLKSLDGVMKVFEAAHKHRHVVVMCLTWPFRWRPLV